MNHEIKEIDGILYRVFPNGGRFKYVPALPIVDNIPNLPGIYCMTQISTGKQYIGSSKDLRNRIAAYGRNDRPNKATKNINTQDVQFKILELTETAEKAILLERELYWILQLKTYIPNGFNTKSPVNGLNIKGSNDIKHLTTLKAPKEYHPAPIIHKQQPGFKDLLLMFKEDRF